MSLFAEFHDAEIGEVTRKDGVITLHFRSMHVFVSSNISAIFEVWLFEAALILFDQHNRLPDVHLPGTISEVEGIPSMIEMADHEVPISRTITRLDGKFICSDGTNLTISSAEAVLFLRERKLLLEMFDGPLWSDDSRNQVLRLDD